MEIETQIKELMDITLSDQSYNTYLEPGLLNSMQYIELITLLEDEYDISFPDEMLSVDNNNLVERLAAVIQKLLNEK